MKTILTLLCIAALAIGIGCASLSEYVTPANIDQKAVEYAVGAGVAEPNAFAGYANLEKAIRLEVAVENAYEVKVLALAQMQEKNQLDYGILRGVVTNNTKIARAREEQLFGETGLLSVGLSALGAGGLAGMLGLMRKRPQDWSPEEMESALAELKGSVSGKDRQLIEVVKGVQSFINTNPGEAADRLKAAITAARSSDTAQAIAAIKATLA
jgi:hypothetical protein